MELLVPDRISVVNSKYTRETMNKTLQRKTRFNIGILQIALLPLFLAACTSFPYNTPPPPTSTPIPEVSTALTTTPEEVEPPAIEEDGPQILRIWLPPEFDPDADTNAGALLRARLVEFQNRRPDLILEVRIKSVEGQASLLNSLIAAKQAAPSAMPDLIALTRPDLESAALQGILHPIDGLTTLLDDPDWFPYARPLAHIQNSTYGLPFAANLLGLLQQSVEVEPLIITTEDTPEEISQIIFPADNAQSELAFCLYTANGNTLRDEHGQPTLAKEALTSLLAFFQSDLISPASAVIANDEEIWGAFTSQPNLDAIIWTSDYLEKMPAEASLAPIPGPEESSCSLASAWIWGLAGASPDLQPAAVELAEFLSDSLFLADWTRALGKLPPRPTALDETQIALHELSLIAQPIPSADIIQELGEILQAATISVLQEQVSPDAAAEEALENLHQ